MLHKIFKPEVRSFKQNFIVWIALISILSTQNKTILWQNFLQKNVAYWNKAVIYCVKSNLLENTQRSIKTNFKSLSVRKVNILINIFYVFDVFFLDEALIRFYAKYIYKAAQKRCVSKERCRQNMFLFFPPRHFVQKILS